MVACSGPRHQQHADVVAGMRAALAAGAFHEDVIALEARKAAQTAGRHRQPAPSRAADTIARAEREGLSRYRCGGRRPSQRTAVGGSQAGGVQQALQDLLGVVLLAQCAVPLGEGLSGAVAVGECGQVRQQLHAAG